MEGQVGGDAASPNVFFDPLVRRFEKAKVDFSIDCVDDIKICFDSDMTLPVIQGLGVGKRFITLTSREMASIFDEYIPHIKELIDQQISKIAARGSATSDVVEIALVGGGSLSLYVLSKLQQAYPDHKVSGQEHTGFSMVAKGAFLASVDPNFRRREFARTSYGALYSVQYDPKKHDAADAIKAPAFYSWGFEVPDTIYWAVKKGQEVIDPEIPMVIEGHHYIEEEHIEWPLELEQIICKSKDDALCLQDGFKFDSRKHPTIHYAGKLTMEVQHHDCSFRIQRQAGKKFLEIETRAIPRWDGVVMFWQFVVHRSGKFPNRDFSDLSDCIIEEKALEDALQYRELEVEDSEGMV